MDSNTNTSLSKILSISTQLVYESIKIIYEIHQSPFQSRWKGKDDPLTIADIKSQTLLIQGLLNFFPSLKIVGEEDETFPDFSFDYTKIHPDLLVPNSFDNHSFNVSELTAFVDPLDGTLSFVNGDVDCVTVLLGFAYKGTAIIGIIGKIWERDYENQLKYEPSVIFGCSSIPKVFILQKEDFNKSMVVPAEIKKPKEKDLTNDFIVAYSKNKGSLKLEENVKKLKANKTLKIGATGNKFLTVIYGLSDCYFYDLGENGTKCWDTCAGEALVECFGGVTTGKDGVKYIYEIRKDYQNDKGVVSSINRKKHEEIIQITKEMD